MSLEDSQEIDYLKKRIWYLEKRLEIDYCYITKGNNISKTIKHKLTDKEKVTFPDGIACRDSSIQLLQEINTDINNKLEVVEKLLYSCLKSRKLNQSLQKKICTYFNNTVNKEDQ